MDNVAPQSLNRAETAATPSNTARTWRRRVYQGLPVLMFAGLFVYAAFLRFDGMASRGIMIGWPDDWKYLDAGKQWAEGNPTWLKPDHVRFYRPAIHLLHGLAIRFGGYNDYSIKALNVSLDLLALGLLFCMVWYLTRDGWAGLGAAMLYALVPNIVILAWNEVPNTPTIPFVTFSLFLFILAFDPKKTGRARIILLTACGVVLGIAANMHSDLAFLGPGYVLAMLPMALQREKLRHKTTSFICWAGTLTAGFFSVYLVGLLYFGPREFFTVFMGDLTMGRPALIQKYGKQHPLADFLSVFSGGVGGTYENRLLLLYVFAASAALAVVQCAFLRPRNWAALCPAVLVAAYAAGYAGVIGRFTLWRLFVPLLPAMLAFTVYWYHEALRKLFARFGASWLAGMLVAIACAGLTWHNPHLTPALKKKGLFRQERIRLTYDLLRDKVNDENRLLITPVISTFGFFHHWGARGGLSHEIYFGHNALHIVELPDFPLPYTTQSLEYVWRKYKIRYVLVTHIGLRQTETLQFFPQFSALGDGQPYSYEEEAKIIKDFLRFAGAKTLAPIEGGLYELPSPPCVVVKKWDFAELPKEKQEWSFPGAAGKRTAQGAVYGGELGKQAFIVLRQAHLDAKDVDALRITCGWRDPARPHTPNAGPEAVAVFWARPGDYSEGQWPYSNERAVVLARTPDDPFTFQGNLAFHKEWKGTIENLGIAVILPKPTEDVLLVHVTVSSIELLRGSRD